MAAEASASVEAKADARYDIFGRMAPFLDPHLIFPILDHLGGLGIYDTNDMLKAKFELAKKTQMSDYLEQLYKELNGEDVELPKEIVSAREAVSTEWSRLTNELQAFNQLFDVESLEVTDAMVELRERQEFNPEVLFERFGITQKHVETLYEYAKFCYECGDYSMASDLLAYYRALVPQDSDRSFRALWGKFAADIVALRFDEAERDREFLRGMISKASDHHHLAQAAAAAGVAAPQYQLQHFSGAEALQQLSWLLHWSLYAAAVSVAEAPTDARDKAKDTLIEFLMADSNLNAIQLNCPWLLRYLAAAVITNTRKRRGLLKPLLNVIAQEAESYRDPILEFLESLLINFDFDEAQAKLGECCSVIASDFFLSYLTSADEFMSAARRFIFETYCTIHQRIELSLLATKLHMSEPDAENWVADLIRTSGLDAKIDSAARQVILSLPQTSVYQQVIDKTRDLTQRTHTLADSVEAAADGDAGDRHHYRRRD